MNDIRSGKARSQCFQMLVQCFQMLVQLWAFLCLSGVWACAGNRFLRANLAERAVEKTLATVTKVCG